MDDLDLARAERDVAESWAAYQAARTSAGKACHARLVGRVITLRNQAAFAAKLNSINTAQGHYPGKEASMTTTTETAALNEDTAPVMELGADLSPAVRAIEVAYRAIQRKYKGTPDATIVIKRDQHAWGHTTVAKTWASAADADADGSHFEMMISGENLRRGAKYVAATLLHESSHAFNLAAGNLDTDSNGRHNKVFKAEAERRGLVVENVGWHGFTGTTLDDDGEAFHKSMIATIDRGLRKSAAPAKPNMAHLGTAPVAPVGGATITVLPPFGPVTPRKRGSRNLLLAKCDCGHSIRLSRTVLDVASPTCQVCNTAFAVA